MAPLINITSLSKHRIDEQHVQWIARALDYLNISYNIGIDKECDLLIVVNGLRNSTYAEQVIDASLNVPTLYIYDDYALPLFDWMYIASQFSNGHPFKRLLNYSYFQVSELAIFSDLWDNPIINDKEFDIFYGGTYKENRTDSYLSMIPNKPSTLLVGDDTRWDIFDGTTRAPTIRNMEELYNTMSKCKATLICSDVLHNGVNIPLRYYEAKMCNMDIILNDKVLGGLYIDKEPTREKVSNKLLRVINAAYNNRS